MYGWRPYSHNTAWLVAVHARGSIEFVLSDSIVMTQRENHREVIYKCAVQYHDRNVMLLVLLEDTTVQQWYNGSINIIVVILSIVQKYYEYEY